MPAPDREKLLASWREEEGVQPQGWDFTGLEGRMGQDEVPWDLDAVCRGLLPGARHVLDMGTGGGEWLSTFADLLPPDTTATEGWGPNLPIATATLAPLGVQVVEFVQPDDVVAAVPMPFGDDRFDLVLNRHESFHPVEVARVLRPGGHFVTQQVGGDDLADFHHLCGHQHPAPQVRPTLFREGLIAAGLEVVDEAELRGHYSFVDVAALVRYLRLVPWDAPADFTVERYAEQLLELHRRGPELGGPVQLVMTRFWVHAHRPSERERAVTPSP